jgi:putative membrane protein
MDDELTEQPKLRTQLAEDRTMLANERTFAGWMRTSLACIAIGIGFHALFAKVHPGWLPRAVATAFLLLAIVVAIGAQRRATAVMRRLSPHLIETARPINLGLLAGTISAGSAAFIVIFWLVPLS